MKWKFYKENAQWDKARRPGEAAGGLAAAGDTATAAQGR